MSESSARQNGLKSMFIINPPNFTGTTVLVSGENMRTYIMKSFSNTELVTKHQNFIVALLRIFLAAIFLTTLAVSSAFSQSTYSDMWADRSPSEDVDPESGQVRVFGDGVTDGSYTHDYYVDTTIWTPFSGYVFRSSGIHVSHATANVLVQNDLANLFEGDLSVDSEHFARCPGDDLNFYSIGATNVLGVVGTFRQTYQYRYYIPEQNQHWYSYSCIGPCSATYQQNRYFSTYRGPFYVCNGVRITIWGTSCIGLCRGSTFDEGCY